jgi:nucleotide-binding universal stress UspA family protein
LRDLNERRTPSLDTRRMQAAATPDSDGRPFGRILVPYDDTAPARRALVQAIAIARLSGGEVQLFSVFDETRYVNGFEPAACVIDEIIPRARRALDEALRAGRATAGRENVPCSSVAVDAPTPDIAPCVVQQSDAWHADLVVVGSHVRHGVERALLGSVAEDILRRSHVPVLVVPAPHEAQLVARPPGTKAG